RGGVLHPHRLPRRARDRRRRVHRDMPLSLAPRSVLGEPPPRGRGREHLLALRRRSLDRALHDHLHHRMRLVATEYLTLDGVFEEPGKWSFPFFNQQAGQFKFDELKASDALLLGRKTYEGFAKAWPTMKDTGDFGVKMNSMPKYVISSTLKDPA